MSGDGSGVHAADDDPFEVRVDGPHPSGSHHSVLTYLDDAGTTVRRSHATRARIVEFDADGNQVRVTLASI